MKTVKRSSGTAAPVDAKPINQPTPEPHHGDLRKGAFLRRRADYQMQASAAISQQAGNIPTSASAEVPPARKPR